LDVNSVRVGSKVRDRGRTTFGINRNKIWTWKECCWNHRSATKNPLPRGRTL